MKTLAVLAVVVVAAAATPIGGLQDQDGQFVLTKDYSLEDGTEYSVKYVKPYTPGRPLPAFYRSMDSSEEVRYYLASEQGRQRMSWADRVNKLRHVLSTGIDVSNELFYNMYSKGRVNLPSDRQYYVDSSGEIYYDSDHQNQVVQAV
ncbi:uncharacterized protein LOC123504122 [Portunus trituberculatus]|uniref:uncharacterized protein LOC123504122 n=1 Tax=Portunus trituberculatus TaxID=210409 RepID=UPI001E1CEA14|nr:uncharacterized protein LOC123504122 [Portunus trituberculatus]